MQIDKKFLFNFTQEEKNNFQKEQEMFNEQLEDYRYCVEQLFRLKSTDAIYEKARALTPLEIKYNINRIALNDPQMTQLNFTEDSLCEYDFKQLISALRNNTHCKRIYLASTNMSDRTARDLATVLKSKKLDCLNVAGLPEDKTEWYFLEQMYSELCSWKVLEVSNSKINHQKVENLKKEHPNLTDKEVVFLGIAKKELEQKVSEQKETATTKVAKRQKLFDIFSLIFGKNRQYDE